MIDDKILSNPRLSYGSGKSSQRLRNPLRSPAIKSIKSISSSIWATWSGNQIFQRDTATRMNDDTTEFNYKRRFFILLHRPQDLDCLYHLVVLVLITVACVMLNVKQTSKEANDKIPRYPSDSIRSIYISMLTMDLILAIMLSVEFCVRLVTAAYLPKYEGWRGKLLYTSDYFQLRFLDSVGISTCLGYCIFATLISKSYTHFNLVDVVFRCLHLLQLAQVYRLLGKLTSVVKETIVEQLPQLMLAFMGILMALIFCSFLFFLIEGVENELKNMADSFWLTLATFSTIGYGDLNPKTPGGRLFLCLSALIGVIFFQLPSSIIGNGFAYRLREQRRLSYRYFETAKLIRTALAHHQHGALHEQHHRRGYRRAHLLTRQIANELKRAKTSIKVNRCRTRLNYQGLNSEFDDLLDTEDSVEDLWTKLLHIEEESKIEENVASGVLKPLMSPVSHTGVSESLLGRYTAFDIKNPTSDNQMLMYCINLIEDGVADITEAVDELAKQADEIVGLLAPRNGTPTKKAKSQTMRSMTKLKKGVEMKFLSKK